MTAKPVPQGPSRLASGARAGLSLILAASLAAPLAAPPALAQPAETGVSIIRDAEVEQLLRDYAAPIFRAAGINQGAARIILVGDRSFNAFVANGQKIFINVGALMEAKTPNETIGVIAHETGHIAGGHLVRARQELAKAEIMAVAGMLLGAGAAATTLRRNGSVGADSTGIIGTILGPQELVRRSLLAYQRTEEQAADRAAVNYLNATGQSAKGMLTTFERFSNEALFKTSSLDPYLQSHPLPAERISNLQQIAKASPAYDRLDAPALQARHDMMRAKLYAFTANPGEVARRHPANDNSVPGRYARAIVAFRTGQVEQAVALADGLIAGQPGNPYFYELKGQALLENRRAAQAVAPLRRAVALAPSAQPIRVLLGHALVSTEDRALTDEAIRMLANATQRDDDSAEAWQFLSMAYARKGEEGKAQVAAAQSLFVSARYVEARTQASRAQAKVKVGSPDWLKADDILNYRPPNFDKGWFD